MRLIRLLPLAILFSMFISNTFSQSIVDSVRYAESMWAAEKRTFIFQYLSLTEAEKAAFLPLYEWYNVETKYLDKEYLQLIKDYKEGEQALTGEQLESITSRLIENDLVLALVRKRFHKKMRRAISPGKASLFMQLDDSFRIMKRNELYAPVENVYTKEF